MSMFTDLSKFSRNYQKEINQLASLITKFKSVILAVNVRHISIRGLRIKSLLVHLSPLVQSSTFCQPGSQVPWGHDSKLHQLFFSEHSLL